MLVVGVGVGVVPFAVASADRTDDGFPMGLLLGVLVDFAADEGSDFAQVEVRQQDGDDDLGGPESANSATGQRNTTRPFASGSSLTWSWNAVRLLFGSP